MGIRGFKHPQTIKGMHDIISFIKPKLKVEAKEELHVLG